MFGKKKKPAVKSRKIQRGAEANVKPRPGEKRRRRAFAPHAEPPVKSQTATSNDPVEASSVAPRETAFASSLPDRAFGLGDLFTEK